MSNDEKKESQEITTAQGPGGSEIELTDTPQHTNQIGNGRDQDEDE